MYRSPRLYGQAGRHRVGDAGGWLPVAVAALARGSGTTPPDLGGRASMCIRRLRSVAQGLGCTGAGGGGGQGSDSALAVGVDESVAEVAEQLAALGADEFLPAPHHVPQQTPAEALARLAARVPSFERAEVLRLFEAMVRIEAFEKKAQEIYRQGWLPGALHLYLGEEAIASAVCSQLRATDMITSTHRGHGHSVAKAFFALEQQQEAALLQHSTELMAELAGRATGVSAGRGGSMHFYDQERTGLLGTNGFVGGGIGLAVGCAMSAKIRGTDGVAVSL